MTYKLDNIAELVEKMPAFPTSVQRILDLTSDINSDPRELVAVIEHDPVLVMKILKLVNSPYFSLSQKITSVNHAVVNLGFNTVKHLAVSAAIMGSLPRKSEAGFDMSAFLLHSLATASIAKLIAGKLSVSLTESYDYFICGLLHDFGKIIFAHFMPLDFQRALFMAKENKIPLQEAENDIFFINHTEAGSILAEKWHLPPNLYEPIRHHHNILYPSSLLTDVVRTANRMSKELKIGWSGNSDTAEFPLRITEHFGMDVNDILGALGDVHAEVEKVSIFITL